MFVPLIFVLVCLFVLNILFTYVRSLVGREDLLYRWVVVTIVSTAAFSTVYYLLFGGRLTEYVVLYVGSGLAWFTMILIREKVARVVRLPVLLGLTAAVTLLALFG
jgi:hypothetical protein